MTTFVPPELIRSTGTLTVEDIDLTAQTGNEGTLDFVSDLAATGDLHNIIFSGEDSLNNSTAYASIIAEIVDATDTTEDGALRFETFQAGSNAEVLTLAAGLTMAGATGGDQGSGTINATNLYINGVAVTAAAGDVDGPASSTDNAIARFDGATGKIIQNSGVTISDTDDVIIPGDLTVNGTTTTFDTTNLAVEDSLIQLARLNNAADTLDIGFVGLYDTSGAQDLYAGLFRDATDGNFKLFVDSQEDLSSANVVNTGAVGYTVATLVANLIGDVTGTASGNVANTLFDANTILKADVDDTPAALTVPEQTLVGRITAGSIDALTATEVRTLINVEDGADVTDATNVDAAGAVMEADFNAQTVLVAVADDTPTAAAIADSEFVGRPAGGNIGPMTAAQARTILNVADGAEVNLDPVSTFYRAGIDFTAGTSTTLTLSSAAPGDDENFVEVFFHGTKQQQTYGGAAQWSVAGTTLTFTAAIPSYITDIEVVVTS